MNDERERSKEPANPIEGRSGSPTSVWDLRRAEIEWTRLLQEAEFEYQHRLATAFAHYNEELKAIWHAVRDEELAALNDSAALAGKSDATPERRVEIAREWVDRMRAIARAGSDRETIVARTLAEDQQSAWLDTVEKRRKGYEQYVEAIGKSYIPGAAGLATLAGDEGSAAAMKMFGMRGDEGFA